jgi:hypothetical protein
VVVLMWGVDVGVPSGAWRGGRVCVCVANHQQVNDNDQHGKDCVHKRSVLKILHHRFEFRRDPLILFGVLLCHLIF